MNRTKREKYRIEDKKMADFYIGLKRIIKGKALLYLGFTLITFSSAISIITDDQNQGSAILLLFLTFVFALVEVTMWWRLRRVRNRHNNDKWRSYVNK